MSAKSRGAFVSLLAVITIAAVVAACLVDPPDDLPGIALGIPLMLRAEVAMFLAAVGYVFLIAFTLAFYGRAFTKLGPSGIEPGALGAVEQTNEAIADLRTQLEQLTQLTMLANAETAQELEQLRAQIPPGPPIQE